MLKKIVTFTAITLFFTACGGGGVGVKSVYDTNTQQNTENSARTDYINPDNINLEQDIKNGKADRFGYDENGDRENNYLAVVNYLRSLPIKCNDAHSFTGPSPELKWNELLKNAAYEHSRDMGIQDYFEHDGSGKESDETAQAYNLNRGSHFDERIKYNGYDYATSGENIAVYATKPDQPPSNSWIKAIDGLIKSRHGHCSNIMNKGFKEMGMAEYRANKDSEGWYKAYWTQDFGTAK